MTSFCLQHSRPFPGKQECRAMIAWPSLEIRMTLLTEWPWLQMQPRFVCSTWSQLISAKPCIRCNFSVVCVNVQPPLFLCTALAIFGVDGVKIGCINSYLMQIYMLFYAATTIKLCSSFFTEACGSKTSFSSQECQPNSFQPCAVSPSTHCPRNLPQRYTFVASSRNWSLFVERHLGRRPWSCDGPHKNNNMPMGWIVNCSPAKLQTWLLI